MLPFYAAQFNCVEVNSTYYHLPSTKMVSGLAQKTPAGFEFIIKLNQESTHRRFENETVMRQLLEALKPLQEQKKLQGLLAQFPYAFHNNEQNRRYLAQTVNFAADVPLFVEFRHASWLKRAVVPFLKNIGVHYVNVDEPPLEGLLPPQDVVTGNLGYIRFHGRNSEKWWDGKGAERYDYLYSEQELQEWVGNIKSVLRKTAKTYIFFNNHPRGQAVQNARQMQTILENL